MRVALRKVVLGSDSTTVYEHAPVHNQQVHYRGKALRIADIGSIKWCVDMDI
jgi:hypothetical protein